MKYQNNNKVPRSLWAINIYDVLLHGVAMTKTKNLMAVGSI